MLTWIVSDCNHIENLSLAAFSQDRRAGSLVVSAELAGEQPLEPSSATWQAVGSILYRQTPSGGGLSAVCVTHRKMAPST